MVYFIANLLGDRRLGGSKGGRIAPATYPSRLKDAACPGSRNRPAPDKNEGLAVERGGRLEGLGNASR